ncbi:class I SAM-dependent methyltransferase [Candidatus Roizmanbacteria bacterium]|nr:class I SAM-dependent methyltransferase [Candidatus Roizmanbacteria bacterium]
MVGPDKGRFIPQWERAQNPLAWFRKEMEGTRVYFQRPLSLAYSKLFESELSHGNILCLGIGTGQVEEIGRVNSERITGVDVSAPYLGLAQSRLPKAKLHHGRFQDVLPSLPHYPLAFSSDALDCVNPTELDELLTTIRGKTDKLVVVQTFLPDNEFYAPFYPTNAMASYGGPGIEAMKIDQQDALEKRLEKLGISSDILNPDNLLDEVQSLFASQVPPGLLIKLRELYQTINYPYKELKDMVDLNNRPYPSQILLYFYYLAKGFEEPMKKLYPKDIRDDDQKKIVMYVTIHVMRRLTQLIRDTLQTEFYFTVLGDACKNAGFKEIERKTISASQGELVDDQFLAININRPIEELAQKTIPIHDIRQIRSGMFINGSPLTFYKPSTEPFNDARIQYLIAK